MKYIPLPFDDPKSYVSLGVTLRLRFELNDAPLFGISGNKSDSYLLDRLPPMTATSPTDEFKSRFRGSSRKIRKLQAASNKNGYLALARPLL